MNQIEDFYVTLLSNCCLNLYPDNKTSNFRVILNRPLYLENYKVALSEIIFPNNFNNVSKYNNIVSFGPVYTPINDASKQKSVGRLKKVAKCEIPTGNYSTIEELVKVINSTVSSRVKWDENMLEITDGKVKITEVFKDKLDNQVNLGVLSELSSEPLVQFENRLATTLGYLPNVNIIDAQPSWYALDAGIPGEMFIYTDIIDHQIISNTSAPLLKIIPIFNNDDKISRTEFLNRNYLQVNGNHINNITIECRDAQSNLISFEDGYNLILTLHFTKRNI